MKCLMPSLMAGFVLFATSVVSSGQEIPNADDKAMEQTLRASLEAMRTMNWVRSAELIHPKSLEEYRRMWLPVFKKPLPLGSDVQVLALFEGVKDVAHLRSLEPDALYIRSMKALQSQFWEVQRKQFDVQEKVIGFVREGADHAFAVVRVHMKSKDTEMTKMEVVGLKRDGARWKVLLPDVVRNLADTLVRTSVAESPIVEKATTDSPAKN